MIQSIEVDNFRCFHTTKIDGFKRINLIAGKNNGGKTSLLEALLLGCWPSGYSLYSLQSYIRQLQKDIIYNDPKSYWLNIFNESNKKDAIIKLFDTDRGQSTATIKFDNTEPIIGISADDTNQRFEQPIFASRIVSEYGWKDGEKMESWAEAGPNIPNLLQYIASPSLIPCHLITQKSGIELKDIGFFHDSLRMAGTTNEFLRAFRIIDPTITDTTTLSIGQTNLYLKSNGGDWKPIQLFGDAISKVASYVTAIVRNQNKVILIDEIENGIHHTAQQDIWRMLYQLAVEFGVQVFATTHSKEMIESFITAAQRNNFEQDVVYFEMARHAQTNEIIGIKHEIEILEYELENDANVRGE